MVHMTESARERPKTYKAAVDFVRQEILEGHLHPGDKLPTERELAAQLDISRNSVREGLRVLENLGVLSSTQGSGNYIALNFDETISEALSFLYHLRGMQEGDVTEFRWMIEREALPLCASRISPAPKQTLMDALRHLDAATTEEERIRWDKALHRIMVQGSHNEFLIASYQALTSFMDRYISTMRQRIIRGMLGNNQLEASHRLLVEGLISQNLEKARQGLENHFGYIETYRHL